MRIKQIKSEDVVKRLMNGRQVCCITFGQCGSFETCTFFDVRTAPLIQLAKALNVPGNMFFEKMEDANDLVSSNAGQV